MNSILMCLCVFFLSFHVFTNATDAVDDRHLKLFVDLNENLDANDFNLKYAEAIQAFIDHYDTMVDRKSKQEAKEKIKVESSIQDSNRTFEQVNIVQTKLEAQLQKRDREALQQEHLKLLTQFQDYYLLQTENELRLDAIRAHIIVFEQVRDLLHNDLEDHLQTLQDEDPNLSHLLFRKEKMDKILKRVSNILEPTQARLSHMYNLVKEPRKLTIPIPGAPDKTTTRVESSRIEL